MRGKIYSLVFLLLLSPVWVNAYTNQAELHSELEKNDSFPWSFNGQMLYWRTTNTAFHGNEFNPGYDFGYQLTALYHINETRRLSVQWLQYDKFEPLGGSSDQDPFGNNNVTITGNFLESIDILNISFSKSIDFRDRLKVEFYGGLQYLALQTKENIDLVDPVNQSSVVEKLNDRYFGFGPRIGFAFDFVLLTQLHLYADIAIATIVFKFGAKSIDLTSIDRRYTPAIDLSYRDVTQRKGPVGGQESSLGISYSVKKFKGKLKVAGGISGASFDIDDTKFSGFFLGATWVSDKS